MLKVIWGKRPMPHHLALSLAVLCGLMVAACAAVPTADLATVPSVDLTRYAGTWYEVARLPMFFQRHCAASKATYRLRPDGAVDVHNECVTTSGHTATADAVATVADPATRAKLRVVFDNFFARLAGASEEGNYWILHLDADYRTAVVGTPDRRFLWILARHPRLDDAIYQQLVAVARSRGYATDELIRDQWPVSP